MTFHKLVEILSYGSLVFATLEVYLLINKVWKRKHEKVVAQSISIAGRGIGLFTSTTFCLDALLQKEPQWVIAAPFFLWMIAAAAHIVIGLGFWVEGEGKKGFWMRVKESLRLERKEAGDLAKSFFRPSNADKIIQILSEVAVIDNDLDQKEVDLIQSFAERWNIDLDWMKIKKLMEDDNHVTYNDLRKHMMEYIRMSPPEAQVNQLGDLLKTMVQADGQVTEEEELALEELTGIIREYCANEEEYESERYYIAIVPQSSKQEASIHLIFPNLEKVKIAGGEAYIIGPYFSKKYTEVLCEKYRAINLFAVVVDSSVIPNAKTGIPQINDNNSGSLVGN